MRATRHFLLGSEHRNWCVATTRQDVARSAALLVGSTPSTVINNHIAGSNCSNCRQVRTVFAHGVFSCGVISSLAASCKVHVPVRESGQRRRSSLDETKCHRGLDTTMQTGVSAALKGAEFSRCSCSFCDLDKISLEMCPADLARRYL